MPYNVYVGNFPTLLRLDQRNRRRDRKKNMNNITTDRFNKARKTQPKPSQNPAISQPKIETP